MLFILGHIKTSSICHFKYFPQITDCTGKLENLESLHMFLQASAHELFYCKLLYVGFYLMKWNKNFFLHLIPKNLEIIWLLQSPDSESPYALYHDVYYLLGTNKCLWHR